MAASGRADDTEILFQHIDLLTSKLEILHTSTANGSSVDQYFNSSPGKQWQRHCDTYLSCLISNPRTQAHSVTSAALLAFLKNVQTDVMAPLDAIKYAYQWCTLTEKQLNLMLNTIKDLDIRWNLYFTKRICQLFVQYCKTLVFFKAHPICKYLAATGVHLGKIPEMKRFTTDNDMGKMTHFVAKASIDPFSFIKDSMTTENEKEPRICGKMARLVSTIGTFIAKLFGSFPLIDWEQLSIFSQQSTNGESTLMIDEFVILTNLTLFKETLFFFMFSFPDNLSSNQCFELIVDAILTETPVISISRTVKLPLNDFLALTKHKVAPQRTLDSATFACAQKFKTSHVQRIMHITFLLEDILHVCEFDPTQLPVMMNYIVALTGFAFYQLDCYFTFTQKSPEAMELLTVLVGIANLLKRNFEDIQRFYVFNLATMDVRFLRAQLNPALFEFLAKSKEKNLAQLVDDLAKALDSLELPEFDQGVRYDFTAFLLTHSRILRIFNDIKNRERVSYLDPIFEHLTTIRLHAMFAQNPVEAFLSFCPIHTLWRHSSTFDDHAKSAEIPLDVCASMLSLFTFFSYDTRCLRQLLTQVKQLEKQFPNLRSALLTKLTERLITQLSSSTSQYVKIGIQSHDFGLDNGFQARELTMQHGGMTKTLASTQTDTIMSANQLKRFCSLVPSQIVVFDKTDSTAMFFAKSITLNLAKFLFPIDKAHLDEVPDSSSLDMSFAAATQYLWTIFASLGSSFPRQLFDCRWTESIAKDELADFNEQISMLDGSTPFLITKADGVLERQQQRLVTKIEQKVVKFLTQEVASTIYLSTLKGFWASNDKLYDVAKYFSFRAMKFMVQNLGIHCGTRIDRVFLHRISSSMKSIVTTIGSNRMIKNWLQDFVSKDCIPRESINGSEFNSIINDFIILGVAVQLRTHLRTAMSQCVSESVPGFKESVNSALIRAKVENSPLEALLVEISSSDDHYTFLEEIVMNTKAPAKLGSLDEFMFYIALMFNNNRWDDVRYMPDYDSFTDNLHLIPIAVSAFIRELMLFFDQSAITQLHVHSAYKLFFASMSVIVAQRKGRGLDSSARAITILADMFPRVMKIEYGRLEESFPMRFVNFAYSAGVAGQPTQRK